MSRWTDAECETAMERLATFERAVRDLADENPGYTYERPVIVREDGEGGLGACSYFPDERNPLGCIVGAAARRLEYELHRGEVEGNSASPMLAQLLGLGNITVVQSCELTAASLRVVNKLDWFDKVQFRQDQGEPWIDSVKIADAETEAKVEE